jgi:oxygen-independent coproporphyrinogen-3 oxidase
MDVKKETQDTFWYPPLEEPLAPETVWRKRELGFYVHIPFCKTVCKYCPFNKYPWIQRNIDGYLESLKREILMISRQPYIRESTFVAGYFGGGTPTALDTEQIQELMDWCHRFLDISPEAEISIEANPETVDREKLEAMLDMGINRVSLGIQTFDPGLLKMIGRYHTVDQGLAAVDLARSAGHHNLNIDLLYYLPGQGLEEALADLEAALRLKPEHITAYPLILSEGTPLQRERGRGKIPPQGDRHMEDQMARLVQERLTGAGYGQYLVWDFALPGSDCLHHRWCLEPPHREYIGLGAGAYSHIRGCTYLNLHGLNDYCEAVVKGRFPVSFGKKLTIEDEMHRYMVLGIYFVSLKKSLFQRRFGVPVEVVFGETIQRMQRAGWLRDQGDEIRLTEEGKIYVSNVSNAFYAAGDRGKPHAIPVVLQKEKFHVSG